MDNVSYISLIILGIVRAVTLHKSANAKTIKLNNDMHIIQVNDSPYKAMREEMVCL